MMRAAEQVHEEAAGAVQKALLELDSARREEALAKKAVAAATASLRHAEVAAETARKIALEKTQAAETAAKSAGAPRCGLWDCRETAGRCIFCRRHFARERRVRLLEQRQSELVRAVGAAELPARPRPTSAPG